MLNAEFLLDEHQFQNIQYIQNFSWRETLV
jgi:hypothetical protein